MIITMVFHEDDMPPQEEEDHIQLTPPAKVRVTYYECQKPHYVTTPDSSEFSFNLLTLSSTMASSDDVQKYISMNMGVDNPFRPEGELSREAENLVKQVQSGQSLTSLTQQNESETTIKPCKGDSLINIAETSVTPAVIEIQHGIVVPPSSSSNVEQVNIKKKIKCFCCVIL